MPRRSKKSRRLMVGADTFLWSLRHAHHPDPGRDRDCRHILTIRRHGARGRLLIVFREGAGRVVAGAYMPSGVVATADAELNLNQPGTIRALLDETIARGWDPDDPAVAEIDGWTLFDTVTARRTAAPQG